MFTGNFIVWNIVKFQEFFHWKINYKCITFIYKNKIQNLEMK